MAFIQLTLSEIDLIATYAIADGETPFSGAFEAATAEFYGADDFDVSDDAIMSRVTTVELPADALHILPSRLYNVADDMDSRAKQAANLHDHESAERLHRGAGTLRALAVHTARACK